MAKNSEISKENISAKEIMSKIRENLQQRTPEVNSDVSPDNSAADERLSRKTDILQEIEHVKSNWNIGNENYDISSHRPIVGTFLVKGREMIHGEIQRYADPIFSQQRDYNRSVSRVLTGTDQQNSLIGKVAELEVRLEIAQETLDKELRSYTDQKVEAQIRSILGSMSQDIENKAWLAGLLEGRISQSQGRGSYSSSSSDPDINYFHFEEKFRGIRADIKEKQSAFIPYFQGCRNVLDIGCGRGEFLEILEANAIGAKGIDLDENMVSYSRSKGLNVEEIDATLYLEKIEDKSLDGIFLDQVIEHLEPDYMTKLLKLCHQKLNYGYNIVVETVNPLSFMSFVNFYIDLTHKKPLHPETLKFLLGAIGFREIEARFMAPIPEWNKLKKLDFNDKLPERERIKTETYNQNIDILNNILFGPQDYALIGKK